ncbi:MAG: hypothetical protein CBB79_02570 [Synechococcus sp. TMED19]|nr:MAG: hypothetical protein CBB79_02570 [Synechococcus sp. TMED19]
MAHDRELDTTLPGVRLLQQWIRQRRQLQILLAGGRELQGRLLWQDTEFLALLTTGRDRPDLLGRSRVELISPIEADPLAATMPSPRLPLPPI